MSDTVLKFSTFIAAVTLYFLLLLLFSFYFLHKERFKKVEVKAQAIDIIVLEERPKTKVPIHKPHPKKVSTHPKKSAGSPKPKTPSIENLFSSLNAKKFQTQEPKPKLIPQPSRFKERESSRAKEVLEKLTFKEFVPASIKSIKSVSGKKDPYLEEVYRILYSYWLPSKESAGGEAIVEISIDLNGDFEYKIIKLSSNELFNKELKSFLEKMRDISFPTPQKPRTVKVRFEAKD
ncbi:MAG: TonB C-terminal domain-containing protein [Epsilonproteobacteria bacterium]|nr:TonB C-terminal domain-containing protein [Campylobacterota bacterium]